jgi:hypothetical protein
LISHALSRTGPGRFFNMVMILLGVSAIPVAGVVGFAYTIGHELARENSYYRRFGENWERQYEADWGSLASAHTKIAVAALALAAIVVLGVWLYRQLVPALCGEGYRPGISGRQRRKRKGAV